jgi:hypothetical protein
MKTKTENIGHQHEEKRIGTFKVGELDGKDVTVFLRASDDLQEITAMDFEERIKDNCKLIDGKHQIPRKLYLQIIDEINTKDEKVKIFRGQ